MKTAIFTTLFSALLIGFTFAQSPGPGNYPRWRCELNESIHPDLRTQGSDFSCWAQCAQPNPDESVVIERDMPELRVSQCAGQERTDSLGGDEQRCEQSLGIPAQCLPASSGGGTSNADKALIAGGVAIAAVAAYNFLYPEMPKGLNVRPVANLAYRDGLAVSIAGLKGEWRNLEFSAMSANAGEGWAKPYARVQWTWAF